jgi:carbonic anhydrase/acetyltransferase-like protein (isoleucine patch superfamily)
MSGVRTAARLALEAQRRAGVLRARARTVLVRPAYGALGRRSMLMPPLRVNGEDRIWIGDEVFVGPGGFLNVIEEDGRRGAIRIGSGTEMTAACTISSVVSVELGDRVLMARGVYIADHGHAFADPDRAILEQGLDRIAPVAIGDGAWLGQNVFVGPGVRIGENAVVGANSVVLDDVPARCVAVGAPARVVRRPAD